MLPELKSNRQKRTLVLLALALIAFWTPVIVFCKLAGEVLEREPITADTSILLWAHAHATHFYDWFFLAITTMGSVAAVVPLTALLVGWLWRKKQRQNAAIVFFSVAGAGLANFVLKQLFHRERPALWHSWVTETNYSFPSGHAMLSCALILSIIAVTWHTRARWASIIFGGILLVLIGTSRVYWGVHYPSDVVAGWCVSAAWVVLAVAIVHHWFRHTARTPSSTELN